MQLKDLINKMNPGSYCEISISGLCDEYTGSLEDLKNEEWYIEHRDCKVINFYIGFSGHYVPEISIDIER